MALWLFRRKSRRKRGRANSPMGDSAPYSVPPRSFTVPEGAAPAAAPLSSSPIRRRTSNIRKQRNEPNKLQRRVRTYSFESGRADNIEINSAGAWKGGAGRPTTKRNGSPSRASGALAGTGGAFGSAFQNSNEAFSNSPNHAVVLDRIPTLHHSNSKRDGRHLLSRTKSSKRRKNAHDREREAEIKAMTYATVNSHANSLNNSNDFHPLRPAAEPWTAGRPVKSHTMPAHPDSFASRYARERQKRPSDVSLPEVGSIDSAMSSDSDQVAYIISPFAAFAPKPTLRYASQPRIGPPSGGSFPNRNPSQRRMLSMPIPEATLRAHKRVDDLANDMNASDLRELMERDKRRRDRKRTSDADRAARRLARQAERQQQASSAGPSAPPRSRTSPDMARGVLGRETAGLGIDTTSAVVTSSTRRYSPPLPTPPPDNGSYESLALDRRQQITAEPREASPSRSFVDSAPVANEDVEMTGTNDSAASSRRRASPVDMFHRPGSAPLEAAEVVLPTTEPAAQDIAMQSQEPADPVPIPARADSKLRKLIRLRKRLSGSSKSKSKSSSIQEERESSFSNTSAGIARRTSKSSSLRARGPLTWGSLGGILRWTSRSKRSPGPSSFSNLSRDSMAAHSSIQRSQNQFDLGYAHSQLRNRSQTPSETPYQGSAMTATSTSSVATNKASRAHPVSSHPLKAQKSGIPQRTMSRFREDLPEFLMSPPASRVQSPEAEALPIQSEPHSNYDTTMAHSTSFIRDEDDDDESFIVSPIAFHRHPKPKVSTDNSSVGKSMTNGSRDTPTSWLHMDKETAETVVLETAEPSPEPQQSLSLASIDSEGSWLSGGAARRHRSAQPQKSLDSVFRSSQQHHRPRHGHQHQQSWTSNDTGSSNSGGRPLPLSPTAAQLISAAQATIAASTAQHEHNQGFTDDDETSIAMDDEYLSRLTHGAAGAASRLPAKYESVGDMLPSSDDDDDGALKTVNGGAASIDANARWGSVERKVEAILPPRVANLVKSHEGLMKTFFDGEEADSDNAAESPISPVSQASSDFNAEEASGGGGVQRATSVNLGKGHARHISAGSAKLLDITPSPRNSVDARSRSREPLF